MHLDTIFRYNFPITLIKDFHAPPDTFIAQRKIVIEVEAFTGLVLQVILNKACNVGMQEFHCFHHMHMIPYPRNKYISLLTTKHFGLFLAKVHHPVLQLLKEYAILSRFLTKSSFSLGKCVKIHSNKHQEQVLFHVYKINSVEITGYNFL